MRTKDIREVHQMAWNATNALLAALLLWAFTALVKAENLRHALQIGIVVTSTAPALDDHQCLERARTSTGWWRYLFYSPAP